MYYQPFLHTFYHPEMVPPVQPGFSRSPLKPRLLLEHLQQHGLQKYLHIDTDFAPASRAQLLTAHSAEYVDSFLSGSGYLAGSNGLQWSPEFAASVVRTNGSLLAATRAAIDRPDTIAFSPTSGFHHAMPFRGGGYCTFSGQVIAASDVWRSHRMAGAWIDLDGHFGNSIEDSREFCPELNDALPPEYHINPHGYHDEYLSSLRDGLFRVYEGIRHGKVGYVAWAHGADSHEWDDLGGALTTQEWLVAAGLVTGMLREAAKLRGPVPLVICLFGGYRQDHYESVLELHTASLFRTLHDLAGIPGEYYPLVQPPAHGRNLFHFRA